MSQERSEIQADFARSDIPHFVPFKEGHGLKCRALAKDANMLALGPVWSIGQLLA
jgi:hypothetical protein